MCALSMELRGAAQTTGMGYLVTRSFQTRSPARVDALGDSLALDHFPNQRNDIGIGQGGDVSRVLLV